MTAPAISPAQRDAERDDAERAFAGLPKGDLLLRYQRRTNESLFAGTALLVVEKSRRIGLTWGLAACAVLKAAAHGSAGGMNAWYMGYDQEMAREFIDACAMWARAFSIAAEAIDTEMFEDDEKKAIGAFRIRFASGFKIVALPSVPRALRGKQGLVIIDEAAFHKNLAEVLKAALALLMWGGQVVVVSTHDGVDNPFNQLCDEVRAGRRKGVVQTITFADALADGLYDRIALMARLKGRDIAPLAEWEADIRATYGDAAEEELDCIPAAGSGSLIKPEDLAACEHQDAGRSELYGGGLHIIGRDVARRRDGQIIWGFEMVGDVLWLRDRYEEVGKSFADQDAYFDGLFATRRVLQAGIDQTGMGEKVVEDAQSRHGSQRVVGFLLTGPTRLDLGISLAQRFERGLIRVPPCPIIRADLRAIKKVASAGGGVRLVNEDSVHADRFWAAGIASRLADLPPMDFAYHPARAAPPAGAGGSRRLSMRPDHSGDGHPGGGRGLY
jgi:phage FluMu gp28-like protein